MIACQNLSNFSSAITPDMVDLDQIVLEENLSTVTYGSRRYDIMNKLEKVFSEYHDNWDGHEAAAVSSEAVKFASLFAKSLPIDIPFPDLGADPDGDVSLEWYNNPRKIVTISIDSNGVLYYAVLIGADKTTGSFFGIGGIPDELLNLIRKVTEA